MLTTNVKWSKENWTKNQFSKIEFAKKHWPVKLSFLDSALQILSKSAKVLRNPSNSMVLLLRDKYRSKD